MTENEKRDMERQKEYRFDKLPNNVRQIGEKQEGMRCYIEDYVITYMEETFAKNQEGTLLAFIGKKGWEEAENAWFIYGSVKMETTLEKGAEGISKEVWDKLIQQSAQFFPEGQILGWAASISMQNSHNENNIMQIHKTFFGQNSPICFVKNHGEQEEKFYCWKNGNLQKMSGYMIFYTNNPQMQEYVLQGSPQKSMEADYCDAVTKNVRSVIAKKNEKKWNRRMLRYAAGILMAGAFFVAVFMLIEGKEKIHSLENAVSTLSRRASESRDAVNIEEKTGKSAERKQDEENEDTPIPLETGKRELEKVGQASLVSKEELESTQEEKKKRKMSEKKKKKEKEEKKEKKTPAPTEEPKGAYYQVLEGDTLSQIVWRQYRDMDYIEVVKEANGIENSNQIKAGEKLLLPPSL